MKTVFNNSMVAHVWAQQNQDNGRNSNHSFYFESDIIYSYGSHFPIARFVDVNTVLFTTETYSVTTSGHISLVRQALDSNIKVIHVENVKAGSMAYSVESDHKINVEAMEYEIQERINKAKRAVKYASFELNSALSEIENRKTYGKLFKLKLKPIKISKADVDAIQIKIDRAQVLEEIREQRNKEREEKARAKAVSDKIRLDVKYKGGIYNYFAYLWRNHKEKTEIEKKDEQDFINARYNLDENYHGEYASPIPTMLRVTSDDEYIESSRGARVKKRYGIRAINYVIKQAATIQNGNCLPVSMRVDEFTINEIYKDYVKVGCHKISIEEIKLLKTKHNF